MDHPCALSSLSLRITSCLRFWFIVVLFFFFLFPFKAKSKWFFLPNTWTSKSLIFWIPCLYRTCSPPHFHVIFNYIISWTLEWRLLLTHSFFFTSSRSGRYDFHSSPHTASTSQYCPWHTPEVSWFACIQPCVLPADVGVVEDLHDNYEIYSHVLKHFFSCLIRRSVSTACHDILPGRLSSNPISKEVDPSVICSVAKLHRFNST